MMNIPNILTLFRLCIVLFLIVVFYFPVSWNFVASACLFALASITDWFDGYLARLWNQTTEFGAFFDPVADKVMVVTALCLLIEKYHCFWVTLPAIVIVGREIVISSLREWMSKIGSYNCVAVNAMGKIKTAAQMLAITFVIQSPLHILNFKWFDYFGFFLLYLSASLTLISMINYLKLSWPILSPFAKKK